MSVSKMNALFAFLLVIFIALTASTVQCQQLRRGSRPIQSSRNLKASKSDNKTSKAASPKSSKEASKKSPKGSSPSKKTSSKSSKSSKSSTTSGGNNNLELGIIDINPTSAGPGHLVQIKHNILNQGNDFNQSDLEVIFNGGQLSVGPESFTENTVTFLVPNDLEQGDTTLALRMGNTVSNAVLFFVSDGISIVSPDPGKIVLGEDGVGIAVNLVMVFVADGFDVDTVTNEITSQFGGNVVGQIDALRARQLEVPTETLGELQNIIDQITARDDIESAVMDFLHTPEEQVTVDWTADPGSPGQHESNRVREGVQAYIDNIHPTREGAIVPGFRSIVVLESAVDFTQDDFSGYRDDGSSRSGGIGLYAAGLDPDDTSPSFHGTNVVGMIAAELNDGRDAGLLRAIGEADAHGGFNIKVAKPVATHTWAAEVAMGLESGARLFNLSAGQHKCLEFDTGGTTKTCIDGPLTSIGDIVQNNLVSVASFEAWQAVFNKVVLLMEREYPDAIMVVSAGNGDTDTGDENVRLYSSNPSNQVIVVGAHTNDAMPARASYSNYGERVDIAASGTVMASGGDSTTVEGTSYAAPLVVATIAAMRSIEPNLSPVEVLQILRSTAITIENNAVQLQDTDGSNIDATVFTRELGPDEVGVDDSRVGKGARLNVEGAILETVERRKNRTLRTGETVELSLTGSEMVTRAVEVTIPSEGVVFDKVDIMFLVDVSGSYSDSIELFKDQATDLVNAFKSSGADVHTGIASFSDFPIGEFGSSGSGDYAFRLDQRLTADSEDTITAINALRTRNGSDSPESQLEALFQLATGSGREVTDYPAASIEESESGWRLGSFRVIFLATDIGFHNPESGVGSAYYTPEYPGPTWTETVGELKLSGIRVYGLERGYEVPDVRKMVDETGGETFQLESNSDGIVDAITAALNNAAAKLDVRLVQNGDFAKMVQGIEPDVHKDVERGQTVTFDVTFSRGYAGDGEQVFAFRLEVIGSEAALIEEIPVVINLA